MNSVAWIRIVLSVCGIGLSAPLCAGTVTILVTETETTDPLPCRIHLQDSAGKPVHAPNLPSWRDHFVCSGKVEIDLAPGTYSYTVERGPEYSAAIGTIEVSESSSSRISPKLRRLTHLAKEGWWSGETHVHRPLKDVELLMRAEDLHVAPVITWWNNQNYWATNPIPERVLAQFDSNRFYHVMGGEDERGGGALLYFNRSQPLAIRGSQREHPASSRFLADARAQSVLAAAASDPLWVDIEKPFWWDTPVWLATGQINSVGIAHNHMHRSGVLENEAWGRARDRNKYPGPRGNGLWTQDIYYHILNSGLRVPPSAGSASGVLPNPVGYNRAYVHIEGEPNYEKWWNGLRAGRVFVSNGPLLRCRANHQLPGHQFDHAGPLTLTIQAALDCREPIEAVELVHNGRVTPIQLPHQLTIAESGWFLVRAIAAPTNTLRFASTGPWWVRIADRPIPVRRASAQFFLDWVRERRAQVAAALTDTVLRAEALEPVQAAERFWEQKLATAVP